MKRREALSLLFVIILIPNFLFIDNVEACKDIIAVDNATDGDYNLLLKVRDPSRLGPQVLCIVPEGYEYTYHHPWTGKSMEFTVDQNISMWLLREIRFRILLSLQWH